MSKRPYLLTHEAAREVAEELLDDVVGWLGESGIDEECVKENLTDTFLDSTDWDGYNLTKYLDENFGFSGDRELVDIMDRAETFLHSALETVQKNWVIDNKIKPKFGKGDAVVVSVDMTKLPGTIKAIDSTLARYHVFIPGKCVEEGMMGTHSYIWPFETVEAWSGKSDPVQTAAPA